MNPETRNLVAAICLSMAVLIGYQILFVDPKKDLYQQEKITKENNDTSNIPLPENLGNGIITLDNTEPTEQNKTVPRISMESKDSICKFGLKKGIWLGFKRIIKCHPWGKSGHDPIK